MGGGGLTLGVDLFGADVELLGVDRPFLRRVLEGEHVIEEGVGVGQLGDERLELAATEHLKRVARRQRERLLHAHALRRARGEHADARLELQAFGHAFGVERAFDVLLVDLHDERDRLLALLQRARAGGRTRARCPGSERGRRRTRTRRRPPFRSAAYAGSCARFGPER